MLKVILLRREKEKKEKEREEKGKKEKEERKRQNEKGKERRREARPPRIHISGYASVIVCSLLLRKTDVKNDAMSCDDADVTLLFCPSLSRAECHSTFCHHHHRHHTLPWSCNSELYLQCSSRPRCCCCCVVVTWYVVTWFAPTSLMTSSEERRSVIISAVKLFHLKRWFFMMYKPNAFSLLHVVLFILFSPPCVGYLRDRVVRGCA